MNQILTNEALYFCLVGGKLRAKLDAAQLSKSVDDYDSEGNDIKYRMDNLIKNDPRKVNKVQNKKVLDHYVTRKAIEDKRSGENKNRKYENERREIKSERRKSKVTARETERRERKRSESERRENEKKSKSKKESKSKKKKNKNK